MCFPVQGLQRVNLEDFISLRGKASGLSVQRRQYLGQRMQHLGHTPRKCAILRAFVHFLAGTGRRFVAHFPTPSRTNSAPFHSLVRYPTKTGLLPIRGWSAPIRGNRKTGRAMPLCPSPPYLIGNTNVLVKPLYQ